MPETLAQLLKRLREEHKMSQRDLEATSGISYGTLANYETKPSNPRQGHVKRLSQALDVPEGQIWAAVRGEQWIPPKGTNTRAQQIGQQILKIMQYVAVEVPIYEAPPPAPPVDYMFLPIGGSAMKKPEGYILKTNDFSPHFIAGDVIIVDPKRQPREGDTVCAIRPDNSIVLGQYAPHNNGGAASILAGFALEVAFAQEVGGLPKKCFVTVPYWPISVSAMTGCLTSGSAKRASRYWPGQSIKCSENSVNGRN